MEATLMQQAPAVARWRRCVGDASLAGHGKQQHLAAAAGVVRLGVARRAAATGAVRATCSSSNSSSRMPSPVRALVTEEAAVGEVEEESGGGAVRLFVGLPADAVVSDGCGVSRPRAVSAALRALKLLGVDGVELPVSWAVVQPGGSGGWFEWAAYRAVAAMVRDAGLDLRVSLRTDGDAVPEWVADAADADPDVLFTDRSGNRRVGCLSFAVDELPVLLGKSPIQAYEAFFRSFADEFDDFLGSTITDVTVSLGPNGELQYPFYPPANQGGADYAGIGEFQCYDKYMLARLKRHAESSGQPMWGMSGPHDGPRYDDESPESCAFFSEPGGSWKSAYGEFFLSWYAGELLAHGDRVLAAASRAFGDKPVALSAKVPLLLRRGAGATTSRRAAADATAGLHGGYGPVAEMFARHGCAVIASGVDATAEERLAAVKAACAEHGARLAAESASLAAAGDDGSGAVWMTAGRTRPCQFTYQRMGAEFFSPAHWPLFVQFVRALERPDQEAHEDDLPVSAGGGERLTVPSAAAAAANPQGEAAREVQTV